MGLRTFKNILSNRYLMMPINRGIIGHVEWKDGSPACNIVVKLTEKDVVYDDKLPSTRTDSDGNFFITYHPDLYSLKEPFRENPDLELIFEYKKNDILKKFKIFYKNVKDEWLIIKSIRLDDSPEECKSLEPLEEIYEREHIFLINLKDKIDLDNIENNEFYEVYFGDILEFSDKSIIPDRTTLKVNSWGCKVILADVIREGSINKEEMKLTEKGIESLNKRKAKFDEITLLFHWIDKDGNIIHNSIYNKSNTNYI